MKKRVAVLLILLLTVLSAAGCGNTGLEDYKKAAEKTEQIKSGQMSGEFSAVIDFNTEGMPQEDRERLNSYKETTGSFQAVYDQNAEKEIYRNYLNVGGLGFDFDLYLNGEEQFMKLPVSGKYMKLNDLVKELNNNEQELEGSVFLSKETEEALNDLWVSTLEEENVFKGKDIVLTTPDGEVKTTVYTITLGRGQIREFLSGAIEILSKDEKLNTNLSTILSGVSDSQRWDNSGEFFSQLKEQMKKNTDLNFQYTAYVDIDGYIVNEIITFQSEQNAAETGETKGIQYKLELKNWDINRKQEFDFPKLTEENTMKADRLENSMPLLFQDFFRKNK